MVYLRPGSTVDYESLGSISGMLRQLAILEFVNIYHKNLNRFDPIHLFGDEIEYLIVNLDHSNFKSQLLPIYPHLYKFIQDNQHLNPDNLKRVSECLDKTGLDCKIEDLGLEKTYITPEYASYMVECIPDEPYSLFSNYVVNIRKSIYNRRKRLELILLMLGYNHSKLTTLTNFLRLGCDDCVYLGDEEFRAPLTNDLNGMLSNLFPDICLSPFSRFLKITHNIRLRRKGTKIYVKKFRGAKSEEPPSSHEQCAKDSDDEKTVCDEQLQSTDSFGRMEAFLRKLNDSTLFPLLSSKQSDFANKLLNMCSNHDSNASFNALNAQNNANTTNSTDSNLNDTNCFNFNWEAGPNSAFKCSNSSSGSEAALGPELFNHIIQNVCLNDPLLVSDTKNMTNSSNKMLNGDMKRPAADHVSKRPDLPNHSTPDTEDVDYLNCTRYSELNTRKSSASTNDEDNFPITNSNSNRNVLVDDGTNTQGPSNVDGNLPVNNKLVQNATEVDSNLKSSQKRHNRAFDRINTLDDDLIFMDTTGFGMGMCCLQITFSCADLAEARYIYDQFVVLTPIFLSLSSATVGYRGLLADSDNRWSVLVQAMDDLNEDREIVRKGRYNTSSLYISNSPFCLENYKYLNDIPVASDSDSFVHLLKFGVDPILARHISHNMVYQPLVVYEEDFRQVDCDRTDMHYQIFHATNWTSVRLNHPKLLESLPSTPRANSASQAAVPPSLPWRVEFRPLEIQLTDEENVMFISVVSYVVKVLKLRRLNLYMPISMIDINTETSAKIESCHKCSFYFRDDVTSNSVNVSRYSLHDILFGQVGLFSIVLEHLHGELAAGEVSKEFHDQLLKYFTHLKQLTLGNTPTNATKLRRFIHTHPSYTGDGSISDHILYDIIQNLTSY